MMLKQTSIIGGVGLAAAALVAGSCRDSLAPAPHRAGGPVFAAATGTGPALDQQNGTLGASGTAILKGFNPTNPHHGSAIIATFFWGGSTNIVSSVTDHLTDGTPVGNTYTLAEYVTAGGLSMATYVATNVQNFPDPNPDQDKVLVVQANLASPITQGGVMLSAYEGVSTAPSGALGAHRSATGTGSSPTTAAPGAIAVDAGALVYGVTLSDGVVGIDAPGGFANVTNLSDAAMETDGEYAAPAAAGGIDPRWTWYFTEPSTWLASVLAVKPRTPQATRLAFTAQPSTTLPLLPIKPPVQVTAVDDAGTPVASFSGAVTIAIGHNGGLLVPGNLSGTTTVTTVNGVATFSNLSIDQLGNGYTLQARASGLAATESAAFNVGAL